MRNLVHFLDVYSTTNICNQSVLSANSKMLTTDAMQERLMEVCRMGGTKDSFSARVLARAGMPAAIPCFAPMQTALEEIPPEGTSFYPCLSRGCIALPGG